MDEQSMNKGNLRAGSAFQAIGAIDYTVIFVRDMVAMRRFYEDILGFVLTRELSSRWLEYRVGMMTFEPKNPSASVTDRK